MNTNGSIKLASSRTKNSKLRTAVAVLCLVGTTAAAAWTGSRFSIGRATPRTEIFRGVFYRSLLAEHGMIHLIDIDLSRPGIDLYLTPKDAAAVAGGFQYRLDYVRNVARAEGLAVAVNGTLFSSDSYLVPMVGDFAASVDTIVANHEISHLHPRDYLLWFDEQLTPQLEQVRPTPSDVLRKAKWAVGGQALVAPGTRWSSDDRRDNRTLLGVDPDRRRLWLGVFQAATDQEAVDVLLRDGAKYVMLIDGGDSTSLYFGGRTNGVPGGLRFGGQKPVATVIGIKADPILPPL